MFSGTPLFPSVYLYSFIVLKCLQEGGKLFVFFTKKDDQLSKKTNTAMIFHLQSMLNAALYPTAETFPASYECVRMFASIT